MKKTLFIIVFVLFSINSYAAIIISPVIATANINTANYALDASNLAAQPATYYTNASNLASGTIPSARLNTVYTDMTGIAVSGNFSVTNNARLLSINPSDNLNFQTVGDNSYVQSTAYGTGNQSAFFVGRASNSGSATLSPTADDRRFLELYGQGVASNNSFVGANGIRLTQDGGADAANVYGKIQFYTRTSGLGYTEKMTIRSNGNVGIGTANPTQNLSVSGNFYLSGSQTIQAPVGTTRFLLSPSTGGEWFSVGVAEVGVTRIGGQGGSLHVGTGISSQSSRVQIAASGTYKGLVIYPAATTTANLMEINSATSKNGDYFVVSSNGYIGVSQPTPSYGLDVNGTVRFLGLGSAGTGTTLVLDASNQVIPQTSSARYKKNIKDLSLDTSRLYKLRSVEFDYRGFKNIKSYDHDETVVNEDGTTGVRPVYITKKVEDEEKSNGHSIGLIAEEVALIYPQVIEYDNDGKPYSIRYNELIPILITEMKKLKDRIEVLERK